jgi:hypothetical protein
VYTRPDARAQQSPDESFLFGLLRFNGGNLQLSVAPGWREDVAGEDREFITELLADWKLRLTSDPEELFEEILSVSLGPLTVQDAGADIESHEGLADAVGGFVSA